MGRVTGILLVVVGMLGLPSCVLAAGAPEWSQEKVAPPSLVIHSTRVIMLTELRSEGLATKWRSDYAQAECGLVPTTEWLPVNEGEVPSTPLTNTLSLGAADPGEQADAPMQLRHLNPQTRYCVRFDAENAAGSAKEEIPFETRSVGMPEVPHLGIVEQLSPIFTVDEITNTSLSFSAKIESNGSNSEYAFEYSLPENGHAPAQASISWKPVTLEATGEVTAEEDFLQVKAMLTGLSAETFYYIRIKLHNSAGTRYQTLDRDEEESVETGTSKPGSGVSVRNVTGTSVHFAGTVYPRLSETGWQFEYVGVAPDGSCPSTGWVRPPGGEGTVTQAQAEAIPYSNSVSVGVSVGGLSRSTRYCVRLPVTNAHNGGNVSGVESFETEGPPTDNTFAVHELVGGSLELLGTVNPKSVATSEEQSVAVEGATGGSFTLTFAGEATGPIAYNASGGEVEHALKSLSNEPPVQVEGVDGGPYTVFFGEGDTGTAQSLIEANAASLTPSPQAKVKVSRVQSGGESSSSRFWFQYVTDAAFREKGWSSPEETSHEDAGLGESPRVVGVVVPGLKAGEGYHFRIVAESILSVSQVLGSEETLMVPLVGSVTGGGGCSNQVFRNGLSGVLPDCRVFEQVTPAEKGAAQEPFHYRGGIESAVVVGEDGEHAVLEAPEVSYGSGTSSGQSPYLFSREPLKGGSGWSMMAGAPQPGTGIYSVIPQVYSADVTQVAFESAYEPSEKSKSPEVEYKVGPIGGPYHKAASITHEDADLGNSNGESSGWVAANGDFSKLVLETVDHELLGVETGTQKGSDLYEYTSEGGLRQLNVTGSGSNATTIGSCGARMVAGEEDDLPVAGPHPEVESARRASTSHSVSADGSRVLFEAIPSNTCTEPRHIYMRVTGSETVDIGAYTFVSADAQDNRLVLKNGSGEIVGYNTETLKEESQSGEQLVEEQELAFVGVPVRFTPTMSDTFAHPHFLYWQASRYDSVEHLLECISCASSSAPEPKQNAYMADELGVPDMNGGLPDFVAASANGDFAYFTTVAALVPQDLDGEIPAEFIEDLGVGNGEWLNAGGHVSPSTDVYEWRAGGVDGCGVVQGCLALITDGLGGYLNLFLGTADEGRDVFFYSRSVLSPWSHGAEGSIGEGNIYDARIGGGVPPPASRPVECEGDECSVPPSPPVDSTPSSFTFAGVGNLVPEATSSHPAKKKKAKPKRKKAKKKKGKGKGKGKGKAKHSRVSKPGARASGGALR
jgi:hypothetical protein